MTTRKSQPGAGDPESEEHTVAGMFRQLASPPESPLFCPPPELVQASGTGTLPPLVQERIAGHVQGCVVCQALRQALDDPSVGSLTPDEHDRIRRRIDSGRGRPTRTFGTARWRRVYAAAAVVALVAAGVVLLRQSRNVPAPGPPPTGRESRQPDASVFQLDKPDIGPRAPADLLWRGSPDSEAADDLLRALEPYRSDDFGEAARRLRALVGRHPRSGRAYFYLGISHLFLAANADAIAALEHADGLAADDADLTREIAWHLALAYQRTGDSDRAANRLDGLCRGASARAAQACAGLRELSAEPSPPRAR